MPEDTMRQKVLAETVHALADEEDFLHSQVEAGGALETDDILSFRIQQMRSARQDLAELLLPKEAEVCLTGVQPVQNQTRREGTEEGDTLDSRGENEFLKQTIAASQKEEAGLIAAAADFIAIAKDELNKAQMTAMVLCARISSRIETLESLGKDAGPDKLDYERWNSVFKGTASALESLAELEKA